MCVVVNRSVHAGHLHRETETEGERWLLAVLALLRIELYAFYVIQTHITCMCEYIHTHTNTPYSYHDLLQA